MALKLAITGKGGVGKSTLAGTLALLYARNGLQVLAIDADPDANLASALGLPTELRQTLHTISDERRLIEERTGAKVREFGQIFSLNPDVTGIVEEFATQHAGVGLLVLGAAQRAGAGCACPDSVLLKSLVREVVLHRNEVVILDMEAGIEHLGRGTAMGVDLMLAVVEPGQRSIETAHRVREMSASIGITRFAVVLNKSVSPLDDRTWVAREFGEDAILGVIPFDPHIAQADRTGQALLDLEDTAVLAPFLAISRELDARFAK